MATLVLTAVGSAIGGPIGGAIGAALGQKIDGALFAPAAREGSRLKELAVQTSSYGTQIPAIFGAMRVAGTVIWATDLIELAGGVNPWASIDAKSTPLTDDQIMASPPDVIAMSWCGVKVANYRPEVVSRRPGWERVPAVRDSRIVAISEEFLGRPGPRVVEGYRQLRAAIEACA